MSVRTYLRAEDRRAQILDVARGVFAQRGYHAANVADICTAARIGRGTLYQYFANKHAVMLAVLEDIAGRVTGVVAERTRVADLPGIEGAPAEMVVAFCKQRLRTVLDAVFTDAATLRLILREARGLDGALDEIIRRIDDAVVGAIEADLAAAQKAGLLRPLNATLVARFLLGGIEKMVLMGLGEDQAVDLDAVVDAAVELQLFGLLKKEMRR